MFPISGKFFAKFYAVCRKSELCRGFSLFGVIFWHILEDGCYFLAFFFCTIWVFWAFYTVMQIHFCHSLHTFLGTIILAQTLLV